MKKLVLVVLMSVLCGFVFAKGTGQGAPKGGNIKLRLAIQEQDIPKSHQGVFDWFAKTYPNVTLEPVAILNSEYVQKVTVMLAGGDDVDLIYSKAMPQYVTMVTNGQIDDLMPRIRADKIDISMYNGAVERLMMDGKVYGLPFRSDIWQLYYNKNLFDKAGVPYPADNMTWDEYAELCKKLTSGSGTNKVYGGYVHSWPSCVQNIAVQDGKNTTVSRDYEFMRPAYKMVLDLQNSGYIMDYAAITTGSLHYSGVFYNQQAATVYQGSWFINLLLTEMKENGLPFEWGVVKAPHPKGAREGQVVGTVFPMCINSKSKNKDMAWEYVKYIAGKECALFMAKQGALAAATDSEILKTFISQEGMPKDSVSAFEYNSLSFETPVNAKTGVVGTVLGEEHSLVMTKSVSLDQFINNLNKRVVEALDE
jgi:multiple sugar transport system substrate-binding protein